MLLEEAMLTYYQLLLQGVAFRSQINFVHYQSIQHRTE